MAEQIDTADHVRHGPSGEQWLVARVTKTHLYPCGWPPSCADLSDCTLIKRATLAERLKLLRELAAGQGPHRDYALSVLAADGVREDGNG